MLQGFYCFDRWIDFCNLPVSMEHLEIELKFYISNFAALRRRLQDLGAACICQRTFEHNARYETEDGRLLKNKCLLRLRKDRGTTLTFKSPPPMADARFKIHRELEVCVNDFDTMNAIVIALGFVRRRVYEKWRETWQLNDATLCVDILPFGSFLEVEGSPEPILQIVKALGLNWKQRILSSYLGIFQILRKKEELPFSDITFDNFNNVSLHFDRYLHLFETGDGGSQ